MKNKNKIIMLGMILLMISLVSSVYAAGPLDVLNKLFRGSDILVIALNSAIIFAGVFTIFNLIKKGLDEKYAKIAQILVFVLSIVVAIELNKNYPGAFLWQTRFFGNFFHPPVIINAILIGAGLYFLSQILLENQTKGSQQLQWAIKIVVVIMAFNMVMQPFQPDKNWDDVKDTYKYVWQSEYWTRSKFYLFGDKDCLVDGNSGCYYERDIIDAMGGEASERQDNGEPRWGILTSSRVLIFALLFFVAILGFNTFVKTEMVGKKFIYAISFLISSNMVNNGTSIANSVLIGQIMLSIVLYKAMKAQAGDRGPAKWIALIASVSIVEFAARTIFGDTAKTFLTPIVGPFLGDLAKILSNGFQITDIFLLIGALLKTLLLNPMSLILLIIIIIALGGFGAVKGAGKIGGLLGETKKYLEYTVHRKFKEFLKWIGEKLNISSAKDQVKPIKPDGWPPIFIGSRPLLQWNQQWNKRTEIYYGYWSIIRGQSDVVVSLQKTMGENANIDKLRKESAMYRSSKSIDKISLGVGDFSKEFDVKGWNNANEYFFEVMNLVLELFAEINHMKRNLPGEGKEAPPGFADKVRSYGNMIRATIKAFDECIDLSYDKKYVSRVVRGPSPNEHDGLSTSAYGAHNTINLLRTFALDLANSSRGRDHTFKFVPKGTKFVDGAGGEYYSKENDQITQDYCLVGKEEWRVHQDGILEIKENNLPRPIMKDYLHYSQVREWMDMDWGSIADDMRSGRYHTAARVAEAYKDAIEKRGVYTDSEVPKLGFRTPPEAAAFDLRGIVNPGRIQFAGRPYFDSVHDATNDKIILKKDGTVKEVLHNKEIGDVGVSTFGFAMFLDALITNDTAKDPKLREFLRTIVADVDEGDEKITFKTLADKNEEKGDK